jgi:tetratricopeptide (TPR) repeat protein
MNDEIRAGLEYQLGLSLRKQRRHSESLSYLTEAKSHASRPERPLVLECANVLQHLGRFSEAASIYRDMINSSPLDLDAHIFLNEILHRTDSTEALFESYDAALKVAPGAAILPATKGYYLLKLGQTASALEEYQRALSLDPNLSAARTGAARSFEMLGEIEKARQAHHESVTLSRNEPGTLEDYACFLLRHDSAGKARAVAEKACRLHPTSQGAWAVLSLCYRAEQDGRESWLTDYEKHIRIFDLEPPEGYSDMEVFNQELAAYLGSLHADRREYLTQTLRNGTRVYDEVFFNGHHLIDRLLPRILDALRDYFSSWTTDPDHPFSSRRTDGFRISGSWSSRARTSGYHVNHVHPKGWISSSYYVSAPKAVDAEGEHAGWIQFGQPSEEFGSAFSPYRFIKPKPGRLVLFPSYVWHGTVPFFTAEERLTIAFDAVPA